MCMFLFVCLQCRTKPLCGHAVAQAAVVAVNTEIMNVQIGCLRSQQGHTQLQPQPQPAITPTMDTI